MSIPGITVSFKESASTFVARSQKGAAGLVAKDDGCAAGAYVLAKESEIPEGLSKENAAYVSRAFIGGAEKPSRVILYVVGTTEETGILSALTYFETANTAYIAGTPTCDSEEAKEIADWIKSQRTDGKAVRAVLPDYAGNSEGIINFSATGILENGAEVTAAAYCSRIVGLLCGTPMTESITYKALPELDGVGYLSKADLAAAVEAGKLCLFSDGESVRVLSGVTSLVNAESVPSAFKKIKLVETADMISTDIQKTARNSYIGKLPNSYDNKCVLMTAILTYLQSLERDGLLENGTSSVDIDLDAQTAYLEENDVSAVDMTEEEIRKAQTGDSVFLALRVQPLDAIENIVIQISL